MNLATLGLPKKTTHVARTAEELQAPAHFPQVPALDLNKVRGRMLPRTAERFSKIWRFTTAFKPEEMAVDNPMQCPDADALLAVQSGIAVQLPRDAPVTCHYFSLMEEKLRDGALRKRRRPIGWARKFNERCEDSGYEAEVDLKHISCYFDRARQPHGACFDLKAGFFQVPLPSARLFTFRNEKGEVFGLTRLPMGISTAPELMQIITSTLAGDPLFCAPPYRAHALVDVWIDNVLFTGTEEKVRKSITLFEQAVSDASATLNTDECTECVRELDFIGMHFDFKSGTISLAEKNKKKIDAMDFATGSRIRIADLETAVARLMYASSVLGVRLARHYYAIKFLRRKLSELNRETATRNDMVEIPPSSLTAFRQWHAEVKQSPPRKLPQLDGRKRFTLWTDASMTGWGAVLIDESTQRVHIVAGRWSAEEALMHINVLEARAVSLALSKFTMIDGAIIQPKIDNTSVIGSMRKGMSNSADLSEYVAKIDDIAAARDIILLRPHYVRSEENLADYWSRLPEKEADTKRANHAVEG